MAEAKQKAPSKTEIIAALSESTGVDKKMVGSVLDGLTTLVAKTIGKKGPGVFKLPGLLQIKVVTRKATPAKKNVMMMGKLMDIAAKPASKKVKVVVLKSLKEMV